MRVYRSRFIAAVGSVVASLGFSAWAMAQQSSPSGRDGDASSQAVDSVDLDVLMRGPVHEGFAEPATGRTDSPETLRLPEPIPDPIDEQPAAARPTDDRRQAIWLPGYWGVEEQDQYCWVSGTWRFSPPGMRWVPGYWASDASGSRWVAGFWIEESVEQVEYLPAPPTRPYEPPPQRPSEDRFWVPGHYAWYGGEYVWEDGFWADANPNWVWIPAHYVGTPRGHIYVPGYWDYPLDRRGTLFAPVQFHQVAVRRSYQPSVAINVTTAVVHWFVRPTYGHYYFGNYYDDRYRSFGLQPWAAYADRPTYYDPLYTYYNVAQSGFLQNLVSSRRSLVNRNDFEMPVRYQQYRQWDSQNRTRLGLGILAQSVDELIEGDDDFEDLRQRTLTGSNRQLDDLRQQVDALRRFARGRRDVEFGSRSDGNRDGREDDQRVRDGRDRGEDGRGSDRDDLRGDRDIQRDRRDGDANQREREDRPESDGDQRMDRRDGDQRDRDRRVRQRDQRERDRDANQDDERDQLPDRDRQIGDPQSDARDQDAQPSADRQRDDQQAGSAGERAREQLDPRAGEAAQRARNGVDRMNREAAQRGNVDSPGNILNRGNQQQRGNLQERENLQRRGNVPNSGGLQDPRSNEAVRSLRGRFDMRSFDGGRSARQRDVGNPAAGTQGSPGDSFRPPSPLGNREAAGRRGPLQGRGGEAVGGNAGGNLGGERGNAGGNVRGRAGGNVGGGRGNAGGNVGGAADANRGGERGNAGGGSGDQ